MQVQVLRQSADRRALLDVDVFSAKPYPLACSIFFPLIVQRRRCQLAWGASAQLERPYHLCRHRQHPLCRIAFPRAWPRCRAVLCLTALVSDEILPPAASASLTAGPPPSIIVSSLIPTRSCQQPYSLRLESRQHAGPHGGDRAMQLTCFHAEGDRSWPHCGTRFLQAG
jgi:hypothetical protein